MQDARASSDDAMRQARMWIETSPQEPHAQQALFAALVADTTVLESEANATRYRDELMEYIAVSANSPLARRGMTNFISTRPAPRMGCRGLA
jgi:hypothetical protein